MSDCIHCQENLCLNVELKCKFARYEDKANVIPFCSAKNEDLHQFCEECETNTATDKFPFNELCDECTKIKMGE